MEVYYSIKNASKVKKDDLIKALDIYTKTVDKFSETNTNEIVDYIENKYNENRIMFFYVLYINKEVCGFAEYGYLRKSKVLMLDYLCTKERNHTLFYNFYHMIFEDIQSYLRKKELFIYFIATELSLNKDKDVLIDVDSNYFRQVLSFEQFHVLNIPFKQPYFSNDEVFFYEFNLAIKKSNSYENHSYKFNKNFYMNLIEEIYTEHNLKWFLHYTDKKIEIEKAIKNQLKIIEKEYPPELKIEDVQSVNCSLFNKGLCKHIKPDIITLSSLKHKKIRKIISFSIWATLSVCSILFSYFQEELNLTKYIISFTNFITLISGLIAIISYLRNSFTL